MQNYYIDFLDYYFPMSSYQFPTISQKFLTTSDDHPISPFVFRSLADGHGAIRARTPAVSGGVSLLFRSIAGERKQHDEDHRGRLLCNWGLLVVCMLVHLGRGQILSPMKSCWVQAIAMRFTDKEFASARTSTVSGACSPVSGQKNVLFHMLQQRN